MNEIQDLASVMRSMISDLDISEKIEKYSIFNHWEKIVGKEIAKNARPEKIRQNTLFVSTVSPIWANELNMISLSIIDKINSYLKKEIIKEIKVRAR
jgi:predicted nucleic acid-binding Zn ribbon protein